MSHMRRPWALSVFAAGLLCLASPCLAGVPGAVPSAKAKADSAQAIQQRIVKLDRQIAAAPDDALKPENAVILEDISVDGRQRPVYFNKTERVLFVSWTQDKSAPVAENVAKPVEERLQELARKEHITRIFVSQRYRSDGSNPATVVVSVSDAALPTRRQRLEQEKALLSRKLDRACRQVRHKPIVLSGHRCDVYSDANRRFFLILTPRGYQPTPGDQREINRYVGSLSNHSVTSWNVTIRPR